MEHPLCNPPFYIMSLVSTYYIQHTSPYDLL